MSDYLTDAEIRFLKARATWHHEVNLKGIEERSRPYDPAPHYEFNGEFKLALPPAEVIDEISAAANALRAERGLAPGSTLPSEFHDDLDAKFRAAERLWTASAGTYAESLR